MLELTRRMTPARSCFDRVAGAYMDAEGFIDGSFNVNFLNLKPSDKEKNLAIAKAIPFSETNSQLVDYHFPKEARKPGTIWQLLEAMKGCGLKNDALMESFYEIVGENYFSERDYAILVFHGRYDIPVKGADKAEQWESEETYEFLVAAVCPQEGRYEPGKPEFGFLYPAFANRSIYMDHINIFHSSPSAASSKLLRLMGITR